MNDSLLKAREARQQKLLNKLIRNNGKVQTWKELVLSGRYIKTRVSEVPSVLFNRRAYNRMGEREQTIFERKRDILKKVYSLETADDSFLTVPKLVYDFAQKVIQ